ncbi:16S rRNA (guanine(527)-N(7))-methyltransferase RsmG [Sphingomonas ginsenosidivorax]|uniref:Ribosomal RNA small subunit methyltransferase G n=1 Tax=Sphingomonas ginsenosidivorax TaxID=862135 RepID=A0A5C6ULB4_9SPHN|nr:RsmG family class I SAM-dependent methyltransferase [Sphingomonas ginsenosidivorax]TXC72238.1 16S rRNA (guanine(527)-N(7))-methyltransferase RsmG [Sphingomonas ginsenosidivorax]
MTEDDAKAWIAERFGTEATDRLGAFLDMVVAEAPHQNLIAPSTIESIWARHAVDSVQLVGLAGETPSSWIDIGTGGGFPGLAVALVIPARMVLVEPRRRRADFLSLCIARLGVGDRVTVEAKKIEQVAGTAQIISARAVASLQNLLRAAAHCATTDTRWLLPRGRLDEDELAALREHWRFMFHVEQSVTSPESSIVVLDKVSAR